MLMHFNSTITSLPCPGSVYATSGMAPWSLRCHLKLKIRPRWSSG
jgi:hypothetical protein